MPIPFENLTLKDILYHQSAYEYFDDCGKHMFDEWDIQGLEKAIFGAGDNHYLYMAEKIKTVPTLYHNLNETMPFLKFGEDGQHYGFELFLSDPPYWESRGAPLFWAYAARQFTYDKLPMSEIALREKYLSIASSFGIPHNGEAYAYVERFAAGGMSSGVVTGNFIAESLATLLQRNTKYK